MSYARRTSEYAEPLGRRNAWSPSTQDLPVDSPKHSLTTLPWALLLVLMVGCTSTVHPLGATTDGQHEVITSLKLIGVKRVSKKDLIQGLAMRGPQSTFLGLGAERTYFDPLTHRLDIKRILEFYRLEGFLSAKVVKAEALKKGARKRKLIYTIEEGERTKISLVTVALSEESTLSAKDLANTTDVGVGSDFRYEDYQEGSNALLRALVKMGYAFAEVSGTVKVQPGKEFAELHYKVTEGPLALFGALTIKGNARIPSSEIRARILFKEGEPFSWQLLEETRTALYAMGAFASVEFDHKKSAGSPVTPLTVRVREASRYELKLGGGAGIDLLNYELRGRGSLRIASFLVPLGQLTLEAKPSLSNLRGVTDKIDRSSAAFEASSGYSVLSIFRSRFNFSSKASYALDNFKGYTINGPRLSVGLDRSFLNQRLQASMSWRARYQFFLGNVDLSDEDAKTVGLVEPYRLGTLVQKLSYDRRDNQQSPTKGWYVALEVEESAGLLGSQYQYVRASPEARAYYALTEKTIAAARFRLASTLLIGDVLPITQRYFAGGPSSQRGFASRSLSPTLGTGPAIPVGGEALIETSFELRRSIGENGFGPFGFVVFVDGAEVNNKYENLFDRGLHWATGLGLRQQTPVGTIGADCGYRLNRRGAGEPSPNNNYWCSVRLGEAF